MKRKALFPLRILRQKPWRALVEVDKYQFMVKLDMGRKAEWASQVALVVKKVKVKMKSLSLVWLFATPWTIVYETPPSMEFSEQENWSGLPFPSPGDLPNPGIEPVSPALQADAFITWATREVVVKKHTCQCRDERDTGWIPGLGRSPRRRHGNPLQYSCLENPMGRGA